MNKISALVICLIFVSCITDEYGVPDISINEPEIPHNQITTFKAIKSLFEQAVNGGNSTVIIADEVYIEGYVISSDKAGNFFEELIIQNKIDDSNPDNDPRLGFKIAINESNLSDVFQLGQKIYVKLKGLTIGETNGVLTIGKGDGTTVGQIQASEYKDFVIRSTQIVEVMPKVLSLEDLKESDENTLVELDHMQLNRFELGTTFASEAFDEFDGLRLLESCNSGIQMILQTSTFSDFKSLTIPQGNGSVVGILSRDFRDTFYVIAINSASNVNFENTDRCDPLETSCGIAPTFGTKNLFFEDFESQRNNRLIAGNGWTNYIEEGAKGWEAWSSSATNASLGRSARFRSASSGDEKNIGWLITPAINLDTQNGETLRFKTSNSRADSSYMEVLYADDWNGNEDDIRLATWKILTDAYVVKDSDAFVAWFNSGNVDLSCISGTIHIAFKFTGGDKESFDGVYELDDVSIDYLE